MAEAKPQAERLIAESNAKIESTIRQIKEAQADKEKTKRVRQSLTEFRENITTSSDTLQEVKPIRKKVKQKPVTQPQNANLKTPIAAGDAVRMKGQTVTGEILEIQGKKAIVAFGVIKSTVDLEKLEKVNGNQRVKENKSSNTRDLLHDRKLSFKQDIDVRGMRGDEALQAVMYFIDDAIQLSISRVRILHGTGTGALRQIIREYLKTVAGVAHFQDEHVQFGGAGITVIDLD